MQSYRKAQHCKKTVSKQVVGLGSTVIIFNIETIASIWRENMHGLLSGDMICSKMQTTFRNRSLRKSVSFVNR